MKCNRCGEKMVRKYTITSIIKDENNKVIQEETIFEEICKNCFKGKITDKEIIKKYTLP